MLNLNNTVFIKVTGKKINRFISILNKTNIDIYNINYINKDEVIIKVNLSDLDKIKKINLSYKIDILKLNGPIKIKKEIKNNIHIIIMTIISIILLKILSSMVLDIKVLHNDPNIRKVILLELKENGIAKYRFKKSYKELTKIKNKIKNKYKDIIEWLEIENDGTKYIVRVEERIIDKKKEVLQNRNIVAKKDALILKIESSKGEIVKNINEYVKKGDTIISGEIVLNDNIHKIPVEGTIYGEVWYKTKIEYPLIFIEKKKRNKKKTAFIFKFLNYQIKLFDSKNNYKTSKVIFKSLILPISLIKEDIYELSLKKHKYTVKEATTLAYKKLIKQIESNLDKKEYIIDTKKLKVSENNSKIILEVFVSVYENITEYKNIEN